MYKNSNQTGEEQYTVGKTDDVYSCLKLFTETTFRVYGPNT